MKSKPKAFIPKLIVGVITSLPYTKASSRIVDKMTISMENQNAK